VREAKTNKQTQRGKMRLKGNKWQEYCRRHGNPGIEIEETRKGDCHNERLEHATLHRSLSNRLAIDSAWW